jgi:outer membrane protein OmpA-like peptidoglycan-associated protein
MNINIFRKVIIPYSFIILVILLYSCKTVHKTGYDMIREVSDKDDDDSTTKIYLTGTIPIDSVDESKLIFDIWRHETDEYPNNLKLYTRVYDSLGHFVTNMADPYKKDPKAKYFTGISETLGKVLNVRTVEIDSFKVREFGANDSIPYNLVLSVDYSGSMKPMLEAIFEGTEIFVNMKMPYDQIALTSFGKEFDVKVPFNKDKNSIINLYRGKRERGIGLFSGVFDAVANCIDMLKETAIDVPRVMVIFSDGDDNYSKSQIGQLIDSARKAKINIFTIAFGYSIDKNLRYLAQYTGGKFYKAYTKQELISIFRDIYMSLRYYYYVTYKPPKYWGYHYVTTRLNVPHRTDTLLAHVEYDTKDMFPWSDIDDVFKRPILFDFDSAVVKKESYPIMDEIADAMLSYPNLKIQIEGHTDNVGTEEYNQTLSENRAKNVMAEIIKRGVDGRRLRSRGFGKSQPIDSNTSDEGRAKNRRTEFRILAK